MNEDVAVFLGGQKRAGEQDEVSACPHSKNRKTENKFSYLFFFPELRIASIANLPIFRSIPCFVKGIPVLRLIFCFATVIPKARFSEKLKQGVFIIFCIKCFCMASN